MTDSHDELQSLLAAYALHAVEPDEAERVETHAETCPRCRAELDAYLRSAPLLGNMADEPPAELWSDIVATIGDRRTEALPPQIRRAVSRRGRWTVGRPAVAAAAAVVVVLGTLVGALATGLVGSSAGSPADRVAAAAAAAASGPHRSTELRAPSGRVVARVIATGGNQGFFVPVALPRLSSGRTYQLWASVRGSAVSMGTVGARAQIVSMHVDPAMRAFMLTAEPAGGVSSPDTPILAAGRVPA